MAWMFVKEDKMTALYIKGSELHFLNAFGINYGYMFIERCELVTILSLKQGRAILADVLERKLVTADKVKTVDRQLVDHNLAEDWGSLLEKIRTFDLGENSENPDIKFLRLTSWASSLTNKSVCTETVKAKLE